jgi:hypothetical protein
MVFPTLREDDKVLVCAPSNAAIDEIINRLISKEGLFSDNEEGSKTLVRIGSADYDPSEKLKKVTMEHKVMAEGLRESS